MRSQADWIATLSPWPRDGFGLERMRALLRELGDPQRACPAVHVVGTNGKSTATRTIAAPWLGPLAAEVAARPMQHAKLAARIYRRSRVRVNVDGDAKRIFEAVVRPTEDGRGDVEAELARVRSEIERVRKMLANERFVQNAAPEVVEAEREKLKQYEEELEALGG